MLQLEIMPAEVLRAMSGEQRILLAFEMSEFVRALARVGIQLDHPDWSESRVKLELLKLAFHPEPLPPGLEKLFQNE